MVHVSRIVVSGTYPDRASARCTSYIARRGLSNSLLNGGHASEASCILASAAFMVIVLSAVSVRVQIRWRKY